MVVLLKTSPRNTDAITEDNQINFKRSNSSEIPGRCKIDKREVVATVDDWLTVDRDTQMRKHHVVEETDKKAAEKREEVVLMSHKYEKYRKES